MIAELICDDVCVLILEANVLSVMIDVLLNAVWKSDEMLPLESRTNFEIPSAVTFTCARAVAVSSGAGVQSVAIVPSSNL